MQVLTSSCGLFGGSSKGVWGRGILCNILILSKFSCSLLWSWSWIFQVSQVFKIPVVPKEANCNLLPWLPTVLVSNAKSYWSSLLPLTNLTNSSSLQNKKLKWEFMALIWLMTILISETKGTQSSSGLISGCHILKVKFAGCWNFQSVSGQS